MPPFAPLNAATPPRRGMAGDAGAVARARAALELVADAAVEPYKHAEEAALGADARRALRAGCAALLRHCWGLVRAAYGVCPRAGFHAVHLAGDPRNCVALTPDPERAAAVAAWWAGPAAVQVTAVPPGAAWAERHVALGVALHWARPAWLAGEKKVS